MPRLRSGPDAERLYADALIDSGRARLRTYLNGAPGRYLAGYLAVRAVLAAWRRHRPLNGLLGFQALLGITTAGPWSAVPDLTLAPAEFEVQARDEMLAWLHRVAALDEASVDLMYNAALWKWQNDGVDDRLVDSDPADLIDHKALTDLRSLATHARVPRMAREDEFDDLPPARARFVSDVLDVVAKHLPRASEPFVEIIADALNDWMSLVPLGQVTAPFWLSLGGEVPRLVLGIRVTETDRDRGLPSYSLYMVPLTPEKLALLQGQMRLLRSTRMEVRRYADTAQYIADPELGRGLGRNVLGLVYGEFTLVLPAGQFTGSSPSPSLRASVESRLRPSSLLTLDTAVITGASIARRAIEWIESDDFPHDLDVRPEMAAWTARVLALAHVVLKDDDVSLVAETSQRILTELGWPDGLFERVCEDDLRAIYDEDSPMLGPLLDAALVSGAGVHAADLDDLPDGVRALLFEPTPHVDFRRFKGATP